MERSTLYDREKKSKSKKRVGIKYKLCETDEKQITIFFFSSRSPGNNNKKKKKSKTAG